MRYYSALRKAVDGAWSASRPQRPLSWRDVFVLAQRPSFEVALVPARMCFLARLRNAPLAFIGLLQVSGHEWHAALSSDLTDMESVLCLRCTHNLQTI